MKYGYVCTNYNGSKLTFGAIETLMAGTQPPARIVVVDNRSDDANQAILRDLERQYPAVTIVFNPSNAGYFPGLNIGIRAIRQMDPDLDALAIGNNDLVFPADFGPLLEKALKRVGSNPVLSPDVVTVDGVHQNPHVIRPVSRFREIIYDIYYAHYYLSVAIQLLARVTRAFTDRNDESQHGVAQFIHQGHGSIYILTRTFFEHFDELYAPTFLFGEEYFLAHQLEEKGLLTYYEPSIQIQHLYHATMQQMPSRRTWDFSRAAHKVYRRHVRGWR